MSDSLPLPWSTFRRRSLELLSRMAVAGWDPHAAGELPMVLALRPWSPDERLAPVFAGDVLEAELRLHRLTGIHVTAAAVVFVAGERCDALDATPTLGLGALAQVVSLELPSSLSVVASVEQALYAPTTLLFDPTARVVGVGVELIV